MSHGRYISEEELVRIMNTSNTYLVEKECGDAPERRKERQPHLQVRPSRCRQDPQSGPSGIPQDTTVEPSDEEVSEDEVLIELESQVLDGGFQVTVTPKKVEYSSDVVTSTPAIQDTVPVAEPSPASPIARPSPPSPVAGPSGLSREFKRKLYDQPVPSTKRRHTVY